MTGTGRFRIASRGSALARWQAEHVAEGLQRAHPDIEIEFVIVRTTGDMNARTPLSSMGGIGVFTAEVDRAVVEGRADAAVHSLKDLPTVPAGDTWIAAIPERADARDAWIPAPERGATLNDAPEGARVGTGSLRRRALLLGRRPDFQVEELRGNLDTRLARVAAGDLDGAVLACAGITRLGRTDAIGEILEPREWLPAPGQGALAVAIRADDTYARTIAAVLDDASTRAAVSAERSLLHALEGGCRVPIGALATINGDRLALRAFVASPDGTEQRRGFIEGSTADAIRLGEDLADAMSRDGAADILLRIRGTSHG